MKRTEKEIYDFVKSKLQELKDSCFPQDMQTTMYVQGQEEAYHEVLNFIGTVRVGEEKKIVGTTTVDKAFEKFFLDNCPEVKKKLEALEIIKRKSTLDFGYIRNADNYDEYLKHFDKVVQELLKSGESIHFAVTKDEFDLLKEVFK